jgi:hypothetical protein
MLLMCLDMVETSRPKKLRNLCLRHPQSVTDVANVELQSPLRREDEKAVAGFILDEMDGVVFACAHLFILFDHRRTL